MTRYDPADLFRSLYKTYHKNQHNITGEDYIDAESLSATWETGEYKEYPRGKTIGPSDLFDDLQDDAVLSALRERSSFTGGPKSRSLSRDELLSILFCSYGVDDSTGTRPIPSPGQLYPLEIYPLVINPTDIDPGLYHYNPGENVLEEPADTEYIIENFGPFEQFISDNWYHIAEDDDIDAMLIVTGLPSRSTRKYGERGYMFTLIETGALIQALQLAANALGVGSRAYARFDYNNADDLLGLDHRDREQVLISIALAAQD